MATTVWSGHLAGIMTTRELLKDLMRAPFLPVGPEVFCGEVDYRDFKAGEEIQLGDSVLVKTGPLKHPGGAIGYRRIGMHTATREFAAMFRAFLLLRGVDTKRTESTATYRTPTPCGLFVSDDVESVQNES